MKVQKLKFSIVLDVLILSLLGAGHVIAQGNGAAAKFEAIGINCEEVDGNGDINFLSYVISEDDRLTGPCTVEISFVGHQVFVDVVYFPEAYDGTWIAPGHSTAAPSAPIVHRGVGTGQLEGQKFILKAALDPSLELTQEILDQLPPDCQNPIGDLVREVGTIIDVRNQ